jgi:undecaprenyl-diphosphatase
VPLAVFPGGTRNHLAMDLGIEQIRHTAQAVTAGHAAAIDLASFDGPDGEPVVFVNTFSIGAYPELVRIRERWSRRLGSWPASVLAALHVLRTAAPVTVTLGGRTRRVWLVFAGNCAYRSVGLAPLRRTDLADGALDVRVVDAGPYPRSRLVAAALTGGLGRREPAGSPVYTTARLRSLRVEGLEPGTRLAYDGEVAPAPGELTIRKLEQELIVYRP